MARPERQMASDLSSRFVEYLRQSKHLTTVDGRGDAAGQDGSDRRRAKLWELTNLSANEFADEAARFHQLDRVSLQDMIAASPLVASFSQRFLREMVVFPYQSSDGGATLAVADPTDMEAQSAAQIVLAARGVVKVATVDDIVLGLTQRLDQYDVDAAGGAPSQPREDDIE